MQSTNILLQRSTSSKPRHPLSENTSSSKESTTHQHLENLSLGIIRSFNAQIFDTPFNTFASPDYEYNHRHSNGEVLHLDREGAKAFVEVTVRSRHPGHYADVISLSTEVDEGMGHARVWLSLRVRAGDGGRVRERVSVYSWRREGERWVWWTHACADNVPSVPF